MTIRTLGRIVVAAMALAIGDRASAYTAVLLGPSSMQTSYGNGVSDSVQVGYGSVSGAANTEHALVWSGSAASVLDLNPPGYAYSGLYGTDNSVNKHVGYGAVTISQPHALLWSGTSNSPVDLHPTGYSFSYGLEISGTRQVGYGLLTATSRQHALMWTGTAASVVDLHPSGFNESNAFDTSGSNQIGFATISGGASHAILWGTTAASAVDLNPTGFTNSYGLGLTSANQVGYGTTTAGADHALLWAGTAGSKIDLQPASGYSASYALANNADTQVGYGVTSPGAADHALLWHSTAASVVDLHSLLSGLGVTFVKSRASDITNDGDIVGYATDSANKRYAVLWRAGSGVPGDYNNDGIVNAADYVTWRKGTAPLANEVATVGSNTPDDYTEWRKRFGNTSGSGASPSFAEVPEPSVATIVMMLCVVISLTRGAVVTSPES